MALVLQFSVLINASASFTTKVDEVPDPSIKCGECPCVNPCSQQLPPPPLPPPALPPPPPPPALPPPPPEQYCSPPPPRFVYTAGTSPPPPPRWVYMTADPRHLNPTNDPFSLQIYTNAAQDRLTNFRVFPLVSCIALILMVFW
ncbi:amyloid beta A4 precursor protein-binding family B member 1-interacting protein-like [Sesamum indicum]|uniref:Amyloid beta A4 precursor protein-binding family B member 1-interacting protein-like n=1 Tax=Sesamum indicum TaxID=4182 RepID=A0A6I9UBS0_SESIN|nr:amyloid beta A4 precursor protein-binding family B member 1-interacting protein-like [Sesamum indicum]